MARRKKYRLYAMPVNADNMEMAQKERFSRITPEYVLIYVKRRISDFPEITDKNIDIMSDKDRQWLSDCNMALIGEEVTRGRNDFLSDLSVKITELERALVREKEQVERNEQPHGRDQCS